jgi:hypothetical protein
MVHRDCIARVDREVVVCRGSRSSSKECSSHIGDDGMIDINDNSSNSSSSNVRTSRCHCESFMLKLTVMPSSASAGKQAQGSQQASKARVRSCRQGKQRRQSTAQHTARQAHTDSPHAHHRLLQTLLQILSRHAYSARRSHDVIALLTHCDDGQRCPPCRGRPWLSPTHGTGRWSAIAGAGACSRRALNGASWSLG